MCLLCLAKVGLRLDLCLLRLLCILCLVKVCLLCLVRVELNLNFPGLRLMPPTPLCVV